MRKQRPSRNAAVIALLGTLLLASGCSGSSTGSPSASAPASPSASPEEGSAQAVKGGKLTYALASLPEQLDPHKGGLIVEGRITRQIFDSLVAVKPDGSIVPWLATEWNISDDNKTYTFKLRQDVKFHDGTPFNAEAVKFTLDRIVDPATKSLSAGISIAAYASSEVVDEYTIKIQLKAPSNAFLVNLGKPFLGIVSPTAVQKFGDDFTRHPVGSGPFRFVNWVDKTEVDLEPNPDYHWAPELVDNRGAPNLDQLVYKFVPEDATRIGGVQSGELLAAEKVPAQSVAEVKSNDRLQLFKEVSKGLPYTLIFNQKQQPWNDVRLRQAVQAALDVDTIVKTLYLGTYDRAWSALTPGVVGYDKSLENSYQPDTEKANRLLDEAGWRTGSDGIREKDGAKLKLHYILDSANADKSHDIAQFVKQQLKKVGIDVFVDITADVGTFLTKTGDFNLYATSVIGDDPDGLRGFYHSGAKYLVGGTQNLAGIEDPDIDHWIDEGAVVRDQAQREELYGNVQRRLIEQASIIPIYVPSYTVIASKKVEGLKFDGPGYPLFNDVYLQK